MSLGSQTLVFLVAITLFAASDQTFQARVTVENDVKTKVYLSPKITQYPGLVSNKIYYNIEFPKGHIAIKSFTAQIVDETGNPVSLQETYLHHWVVLNYYLRRKGGDNNVSYDDLVVAGNSGLCSHRSCPQVWGLGAETRKTSSHIPDPYGIEVGNPLEVPDGYQEQWLFNIHTIDTRGAVDVMGCTECRCNLYNVTHDKYGQPLNPNYVGGKYCCEDGTQCKVINGLENFKRNVYLKYTVKWVDWSDFIVPVKVYMFDVTDTWQHTGIHNCSIEYDIEESTTTNNFTSTKRSRVNFPIAGDVIYGVGHQHTGGIGSALYGEDGKVICLSKPIYGQGNSVGDESGYIVGMSTCYPEPGSVKIAKGEALTLEVNYSSEKSHTGVMGLFYILVAESCSKLNDPVQIHQESQVPIFFWGVAVFGLAVFAVVLVAYQQRKQNEDGYQSIAT